MPRPRQALLSRQRIVEAAAELIDAEGLAGFSTRRLAEKLGVRGPSLYNHFATKDEILDAVADTITAQVDVSFFGRLDWRLALRRWGHSYRAALAAHPHIVPYLAQGPGRRPAALAVADAVYGGLVEAGWPPVALRRPVSAPDPGAPPRRTPAARRRGRVRPGPGRADRRAVRHVRAHRRPAAAPPARRRGVLESKLPPLVFPT
jgi:AcrR family transcriptional regulator